MQLNEAITLINHSGVSTGKSATWADLGCGTGLFSKALANLLPPASHIFALDTDQKALRNIADYNGVSIEPVCQDFVTSEWPFATLDGLLMANSLHYVADKPTFLQKADRYLSEKGCFLLVEYDMDVPNPWVPYPLSYVTLTKLFMEAGYSTIEKIHQMPSRFGRANLFGVFISR
ncbi:class I SAM-dependent methyltransferase [Spirosoma sp. BT702]|uniref:Class I SAM-dependent methyltransferase n=1 Tax=Spirosoma profusum TaxID=2771354 RepID=A0A926XYZ8_9BACT|nr:class I SAM-dependent methyltransferase [Spirosoma profusum]MBD2702811.1 class I SAM-dependent methyltransferase [Spirosoma profusum]